MSSFFYVHNKSKPSKQLGSKRYHLFDSPSLCCVFCVREIYDWNKRIEKYYRNVFLTLLMYVYGEWKCHETQSTSLAVPLEVCCFRYLIVLVITKLMKKLFCVQILVLYSEKIWYMIRISFYYIWSCTFPSFNL